MRQSALTWVRNNHPEVIDAFSAEWEEKLATQHRA
jgi:hypothetical protein